jgi:hypothetical protein
MSREGREKGKRREISGGRVEKKTPQQRGVVASTRDQEH